MTACRKPRNGLSLICGTPVEDIEWFAQLVGKEHKVALLHSFAAARNKGAEDFRRCS